MAKLYWAWTREAGPGLCSTEVPLGVCDRELELEAAQPLGLITQVSGDDLMPDSIVLEVGPFEEATGLAAGFYKLLERRNDPVIQDLLRRF